MARGVFSQMVRKLGAQRGAIVSSADCSVAEIAIARASGRFFVDDDGYGYVLRTKLWRERAEAATDRLLLEPPAND